MTRSQLGICRFRPSCVVISASGLVRPATLASSELVGVSTWPPSTHSFPFWSHCSDDQSFGWTVRSRSARKVHSYGVCLSVSIGLAEERTTGQDENHCPRVLIITNCLSCCVAPSNSTTCFPPFRDLQGSPATSTTFQSCALHPRHPTIRVNTGYLSLESTSLTCPFCR